MLIRADTFYTSTLTVAETLVKPLQTGDDAMAKRYLSFFQDPRITVVAFDFGAARSYARVRQDRAISRPDAIQLACAAAAQADLFITNDARLSAKFIPGIQFITSLERSPI
jgi:predicted nucleic acid-binding protein